MLQLKDHTPFRSAINLFPNEQGVDTLYVVVKATFRLGPPVSLSLDQRPIQLEDEYWGEPGHSSLKYASDIHLSKPGTDVVLIGKAHSPKGQAVTELETSINVAGKEVAMKVFGNRVWEDGKPSHPEPFVSKSLVYEYAYGGFPTVINENEAPQGEALNPVGRGFVGKLSSRDIEGHPLPNLEHPNQPLLAAGDHTQPVCFGYIPPYWPQRSSYAGTYNEIWETQRAPYLPEDFDPLFFRSGHHELYFDNHLQGGEPIILRNLSARGDLAFTIPRAEIEAIVAVPGKRDRAPLKLETVQIEPEEDRLSLLWRGELACDKMPLKMEQVDVVLHNLSVEGGSLR